MNNIESQFRSKLLRRSGISAALLCDFLGWSPDCMYQVGVGMMHGELDVFSQVWKGIRIFGCEPHPQTYAALGDYPGELTQCAVSDYEGEGVLYSKHRHKDGSSLFQHTTCGNDWTYKVRVTTLDALWPDGPVGVAPLLWIDCEGSELNVLRGGPRFVERVKMVNVELTGKSMGDGWARQEDVHQWLVSNGFWRQWVHTQRAWVGQVDGLYVRQELFRPEYCCCPCEVVRYAGLR